MHQIVLCTYYAMLGFPDVRLYLSICPAPIACEAHIAEADTQEAAWDHLWLFHLGLDDS